MKEKSKMIISYLNSSDTYTPSSALAQYLNVSERSIKRYIKIINKELEEFGAKIDSAKGLGYRLIILDDEKFKEYIKNTTGTSIDESVRSTDLLKRILKSYPISLDLLAEELYTSRSTLQNEINNVKSLLNEYKIDLKYKPYMGLYLAGDEEDIRKCCIKYFFKEDNFNEIKLSVDLELINNDFVKKIKKYIEKECLSRNKIKNDYEITYLTKFIVISCFRFINGYKVKNKIENMNKEIIFIFDDKFRDMINDSYNIHLDDNEIINMNILAQVDKEVSIDQKPKEDQVRNIIQESLIKIDIKYKVFLYEDNTLLLNLVKHIMNSYHRYYLKIDVENVILDQVKMSYPEAFNYALELSNLLEDKLKVKINSNEIGYIAIHFATAIERAKQKTSYKSIIVCNTGIGTSELIRTKLRRYFPEIEIVGCYQLNYIEYIDLDEVDFIISTINIEKNKLKIKN